MKSGVQSETKKENVSITPDKATQFIERNNNLRKLSEATWRPYSAQMAKGEWIDEHPDPIVFDCWGKLRNGQHRLRALIDAGVTLRFVVVWNASEEYIHSLDVGRKRAEYEIYTIDGFSTRDRQLSFQIVKRMPDDGEEFGGKALYRQRRQTPQDRMEEIENLMPQLRILLPFASKCNTSALRKTSVLCALVKYLQKDESNAKQFVESLYKVDGEIQQARVLRDKILQSIGQGGCEAEARLYGAAVYCCRLHQIGKRVGVLNKKATWASNLESRSESPVEEAT